MVTIYRADVWCDACGREITRRLLKDHLFPAYWNDWEREAVRAADGDAIGIDADTDDWPSIGHAPEATDSPEHCAADSECLRAIDLREWGLGRRARMVGAEAPLIGDLLSDALTEDGEAYLRETLAERPRTPYQRALHRFWRAAFEV